MKAGEDGATIELTIDVDVQQVVEREISQAMKRYEADQALAIAMNPNTGEILALAFLSYFPPSGISISRASHLQSKFTCMDDV